MVGLLQPRSRCWHWGLAAIVPLVLASCAGSGNDVTTEPSSGALPTPNAGEVRLPLAENPAPDSSFEDPMVSEPPPPATLPVPILIPPTDVDPHMEQMTTGRTDPFAPINPPPVVMTNPVPQPISPPPIVSSNQLPTLPVVDPAPVQPPESLPTLGLPPLPGNSGNLPEQPVAVAPRLSDAIAISGVIEVGGYTHVIVQVPNEPTSRYVRVGDLIANGQVLVKRVEVDAGGEPTVILEENGIETPRLVGSGGSVGDTGTLVGAL